MEELNAHMARDEEEFNFLDGKDTEDVDLEKLPEEPTEVQGIHSISEAESERNFNVRVDAGLRRSRRLAPTLDDLLEEENLTVCIDFF